MTWRPPHHLIIKVRYIELVVTGEITHLYYLSEYNDSTTLNVYITMAIIEYKTITVIVLLITLTKIKG